MGEMLERWQRMQKDQFLRTVETLLKPSARKRRHRRRKEKTAGVEKVRCRPDEMARNG